MYSATLTFSPPLSVRILKGSPNFSVAGINEANTVSALLLSEQCKKIHKRVNPSIAPWTVKLKRLILWCPSKCHRWCGPATEYTLRFTVFNLRCARPSGSTIATVSRTLRLVTRNPSRSIAAWIITEPTFG